MKKFFIRSVQIIVHLTTATPQRLFFGFKKSKNLKFDKNKKYIIASNHPTRLDAFMVLAAMPFWEFVKITPIRFITYEKYMAKWHQKLYMISLGCVSTNINGTRPIEYYKKLLEDKQTLFIFPRGKLEKPGDKGDAKTGVIVIERDVDGSMIIPVSIKKNEKRIMIEFGKIFRHEKFNKNLKKMSEDLMKNIEKQ